MNYDLRNVARDWTGRALLAASRLLARHGARLIGHPSAVREPERPALAIVHNPSPQRAIAPTEAAMLRRYTGYRDGA